MKKFLRIAAAVLILVLVLPMASCSSKAPELDSVKERLVYLIEESKELNVLLFGDGLPVYHREEALADRKMVYYNNNVSGYERVMENTTFLSIEKMKEAASAVYSSEYLSAIYESAFEGVMTGSSSAYVRFYDNGEWLYQNLNKTEFSLNERIYDYSTMKIIDPSTADYINVSVESYSMSDGARQTVYLSFIYENNNWYLDSPSY